MKDTKPDPELVIWECEDKFESLLAAYCLATDSRDSSFDRDEVIEEARNALGQMKELRKRLARERSK